MASNGVVEIVSSFLVRSSINHPPTSRHLTPLDLVVFNFQQIQKGILFPHKPPPIRTLAASLSRALDFFPPLSGRLATITHSDATTSYFIRCNNAGAQLTYAVADSVSVSDVLDTNYVPINIVSAFFPLNGSLNCQGVSNPLLSLQITELADGCFIGCTANHMVLDGASFWHFFNSWAEISRGSNTISKSPVFDPWFPPDVNPPIRLPPSMFNQDPSTVDFFDPPPLVDRVFHFGKNGLARLKEKANSEAGCCHISTFQALAAHLWRGVVRSRHKLNGKIKDAITGGLDRHIPVIVDARLRIPLPVGYFGNGARAIMADHISEDELIERGVGFAALKIHEMVRRQTRESIIKFMEEWIRRPFFPGRMRAQFAITSSPRFDVYGCDFGWGKPIAARNGSGQRFDGRITIDPAAEPGGTCAVACLAPATMRVLEKDAEFLEFVTI